MKGKRRKAKSKSVGLIIGLIIALVVLAALALVVARRVISSNEEAQSQMAAESQAQEQAELEIQEPSHPMNILTKEVDRSTFAVQPGIVPGGDATDKPIIYLTFDDGPSYLTEQVLEILDEYNVKATFFVTGFYPDYYYCIKEAYDRGHTIGLHTCSHDYAQVYSSDAAYFADLEAIGNIVRDQIGYVPCFIRFPGGSSNMISANYSSGIMSRLAAEVQARGYQYYDWNVSAGDGSVHTADEIVGYSCGSEYTNILFLCHDGVNKETTVEALPQIIEHYLNRGYEFRPLDREAICAHHGIGN